MRNTILVTTILCLSAFGLAVSGCVKEKADKNGTVAGAAIETQRIEECSKKENPYPSQINAHIEGDWVWTSKNCPFGGSTTAADKQVVVKFTDGALYQVFENGTLATEGSFALESSYDGQWRIVPSVATEYINGNVLLCGNELIFTKVATDGCEYYYVRK